MAAVHPPTRPILLSTVSLELVVVSVSCTELHAIVRRVEFVTGIVTKVVTIEGIASISTKVISIRQAVSINFWPKLESGIVCISEKVRRICNTIYWPLSALMLSSMFDLAEKVMKCYLAKINFGSRAKSCLTTADKEHFWIFFSLEFIGSSCLGLTILVNPRAHC